MKKKEPKLILDKDLQKKLNKKISKVETLSFNQLYGSEEEITAEHPPDHYWCYKKVPFSSKWQFKSYTELLEHFIKKINMVPKEAFKHGVYLGYDDMGIAIYHARPEKIPEMKKEYIKWIKNDIYEEQFIRNRDKILTAQKCNHTCSCSVHKKE